MGRTDSHRCNLHYLLGSSLLYALMGCDSVRQSGPLVGRDIHRPESVVIFARSAQDAFDQARSLLDSQPQPGIIHIHHLLNEAEMDEDGPWGELNCILHHHGYSAELQGAFGEYLPPYGEESVVCSMWMSSYKHVVRYSVKDEEIGSVIHWELERVGVAHFWALGGVGTQVFVGVHRDDVDRALAVLEQCPCVRARMTANQLFLEYPSASNDTHAQ